MPTEAENIQYLYLVLTHGGPPTIDWAAVGTAMDLKQGAVTKRWSRLKQTMAKNEKPAASAYKFLWLCIKHSTRDTTPDWNEIAKECNTTPGAASKRYSRMKQAFDSGAAPPTAAPSESGKPTPKKTAAGKAKDADGTPTPKRKRAAPKKKAIKQEEDDDEDDEEADDENESDEVAAADAAVTDEESDAVANAASPMKKMKITTPRSKPHGITDASPTPRTKPKKRAPATTTTTPTAAAAAAAAVTVKPEPVDHDLPTTPTVTTEATTIVKSPAPSAASEDEFVDAHDGEQQRDDDVAGRDRVNDWLSATE